MLVKSALGLAAVLYLPACFIFTALSTASESVSSVSTSLESISTSVQSISSSFASSVASSAPDEEEQEAEDEAAYRRDVRNYTQAFVVAGGSDRQFQRELGRIARLHGLVNWQNRASTLSVTFEAIGAGLRGAGVDRALVVERFAALHPAARTSLLLGYERSTSPASESVPSQPLHAQPRGG